MIGRDGNGERQKTYSRTELTSCRLATEPSRHCTEDQSGFWCPMALSSLLLLPPPVFSVATSAGFANDQLLMNITTKIICLIQK